MSRLASIAFLGIALALTPVYAQRGGGGGRSGGGGGSHSSGSSVSRGGGGGGGFSSSRSSSSMSSSRSSSSRSSSSMSSSRSSFSSSSSRGSSSSYSGASTRSSVTGGAGSSSRSDYSSGRSYSGSRSGGYDAPSRGSSGSAVRSESSMRSRTGSVPAQVRSRAAAEGRAEAASRGGVRAGGPAKDGSRVAAVNGRPSGIAPTPEGRYARPGHPGPLPPSHRPIHPAPYFWHPHHHCMVHCHRLYWDPFIPRPYYWPGFWVYCDSYWYDYHVTDMVVVREYVRDTYKLDLITYAFSGNYMYALVNDPDGHTYLQIYDREDKLLAEQRVSRKYCKIEVDPENGGCWIMKKRDKDPLLFFYTEDGQLLIYEAD
ncbi:MAG: hypothetical protein IJ785_01440 [Bacteroidales bacterium]|nr:hypothetical protein [Bacteroidales bacterium]